MENQAEEIIDKIKKSHPGIEISVSVNFFLESLVHVRIKDSLSRGFGQSTDHLIALQKAYGEFVERKIMQELRLKSSNGLAVHITPQLARESALSELIERDAFLLGWFGHKSPLYYSKEESNNIFPEATNKLLRHYGFDYKLGIIAHTQNQYVVIGMLHNSGDRDRSKIKIGMAVDTTSKVDLRESLRAASLSVLYHADLCKFRYELESPIFRLPTSDNFSSPIEHLEYHLNPNADNLWYQSSREILEIPSFNSQVVDIPINFSTAIELFAARATSEDCQGYFSGKTEGKINVKRYEKCFSSLPHLGFHPLS